jgi:hypothetical protein
MLSCQVSLLTYTSGVFGGVGLSSSLFLAKYKSFGGSARLAGEQNTASDSSTSGVILSGIALMVRCDLLPLLAGR